MKTKNSHELERERIEADVEKFLAGGGKIKKVKGFTETVLFVPGGIDQKYNKKRQTQTKNLLPLGVKSTDLLTVTYRDGEKKTRRASEFSWSGSGFGHKEIIKWELAK